jgi:hypothetical protein
MLLVLFGEDGVVIGGSGKRGQRRWGGRHAVMERGDPMLGHGT